MREIRTDRLLLRPFRESDYDDLFEYLSQLEMMNLRDIRGSLMKTAESIWNIV